MAQKNVLKYIILGMLAHRELAGYDIKKLFEEELGDFWYSNHSQIYPELRRLEDEGFIASHTELVGKKLEKKFYRITKSGQQLLSLPPRGKTPIPASPLAAALRRRSSQTGALRPPLHPPTGHPKGKATAGMAPPGICGTEAVTLQTFPLPLWRGFCPPKLDIMFASDASPSIFLP